MKKGELIALGAGVLVIVVLFAGIKVFGNLNSPEEEKPPPAAERKPNPANYTYKKKPYRAPVAEAPVAEAPVAEAPVAEAPVTRVPAFKKLNVISSSEAETRPGKEIATLIREQPKANVFVVTAVAILNENATSYYKWFYDAESRALVLMRRLTLKAVGERYLWRVWHDVVPSDFSDGLPYSNDNIRTSFSENQSGLEPVKTFPFHYKGLLDITKWP